jgi:hypothetical protein
MKAFVVSLLSPRRLTTALAAAAPLLLGNPVAVPAAGCDAIDVALGKTPRAACPELDLDGDGELEIGEVVAATGGMAPKGPARRGAGVVSIDVGTASGAPGDEVTFEVTLDTGGGSVAATLNDIAFDPLTPVADDGSGEPDCTVNPAIGKDVFAAFQPAACTPGVDCTGIRVIVVAFDNTDPIPDGSLYACRVQIDTAAPVGTYLLTSAHVESSDPSGTPLTTVGTDGAIVVSTIDHFKCYEVKELEQPKFAKTVVSLSDQFVTEDVQVKKPYLLCNPVDKNGEGIRNSVDHLVCYKIKAPKLAPPPEVEVENQLGALRLEAKDAFLLCVPSTKRVLP